MNDPPIKPWAWLGDMLPAVWLAALVLGAAFFVSEHSVTASLADDFTQNAEEMLATAEGGNTLRRVAFITIAALGVALFALAGRVRSYGTLLGCFVYALTALCFTSLLWADDAGQCLRRLLVLGMALTGALGLARYFNFRQLCFLALLVSGSCILLGVGCEIVLGTFRPWASDYRFSGTVHPNTQGAYLATLCFSALCLAAADAPRRRWFLSLLVLGIVLLILTKSRTSTAGVLATLGITSLVLASNRVRVLLPAIATWMAAVGLLVLLLSGPVADRLLAKAAFLGRQEETESFSGRTTIWPVVSHYIQKQPWLGYGYDSFWTPSHIEVVTQECQWAVREAHSSYFDMVLSLGYVGMALYCATALIGVGTALADFARRRDPCVLFWLGMTLNGFVNGAFESGMTMISFPTFVLATGILQMAFFARSHEAAVIEEAWPARRQLPYSPGCNA